MQANRLEALPGVRPPLSDLVRLTAGALGAAAIGLVYLQAVLLKAPLMPLPVLTVITVVVAGVVVSGWRWAPLLGTLWAIFMVAGNWGPFSHDLAHPENTHVFGFAAILLALLVTAAATGVAATIQRRRSPEALAAPPWVRPALGAVAALVVGAILVAAIPRTSGASVSPDVLAKLPGVPISAFNGGTITVKAGELAALRLENPEAVGHSFDVDELGVHVPMAAGADSLALFIPEQPGTYTFYCAPHYDKASGQGMRGTLVVEP